LTKIDEKQRFLQMVTATEQRISFFFSKKQETSISNGSSLLSKTACATYFQCSDTQLLDLVVILPPRNAFYWP